VLGLRRARLMKRGELPWAAPAEAGRARELPKPLVRSRGFAPLAAAGTAFDLATRRVRQVSQVVVLAQYAKSRSYTF
jgi:hypothetical protein